MKFFQVLSRNNDPNGNPFRLIMVYGADGAIVEAYEARSSSPNIVGKLRRPDYQELMAFHVAPSEYNATKRALKSLHVEIKSVD